MNNETVVYTLEVKKKSKDDPDITESSLANNLLGLLQTHSKILQISFSGRDGLLSEIRHFITDDDKKKNRTNF
jgi:hypothetical protein